MARTHWPPGSPGGDGTSRLSPTRVAVFAGGAAAQVPSASFLRLPPRPHSGATHPGIGTAPGREDPRRGNVDIRELGIKSSDLVFAPGPGAKPVMRDRRQHEESSLGGVETPLGASPRAPMSASCLRAMRPDVTRLAPAGHVAGDWAGSAFDQHSRWRIVHCRQRPPAVAAGCSSRSTASRASAVLAHGADAGRLRLRGQRPP